MRRQGNELETRMSDVQTRLASAERVCSDVNSRYASPALPSENPTLDAIRIQNTKLIEALTNEKQIVSALIHSNSNTSINH